MALAEIGKIRKLSSVKTILRRAKVSGQGNMKEGSVAKDSIKGWLSGEPQTDEMVRVRPETLSTAVPRES
jgi:hypothetical protein